MYLQGRCVIITVYISSPGVILMNVYRINDLLKMIQ
ncbi:hypothetical protein SPHINGO391_390385 [Sphingomonas aurantiaca]|uniref:Uncharacterized protein n=1 Tax=Sphingomonas aurantiaca TaxID=185949 RepID=A0A5E7Z039_9SPHN|nr:hypothetical protein SPHINGO391_390385 [Sphingomonas aurantiaca]